jgi:hypothetical protein
MRCGIFGNFIVETEVHETPDGRGFMTMRVRRVIETGLPLSDEERDELDYLEQTVDTLAASHGAQSIEVLSRR